MRKWLLTIIFFHSVFYTNAQTPCDLIKEYSIATCKRDTKKAIATLEKFVEMYPADSLIENVNLEMARWYFDRDLNRSRDIALKIISRKNGSFIVSFDACPVFYDSTDCR